MKNQRGITLVALVITIIVLLILAGVSISLVVGNNGVLTQASNAVVQNKRATENEEIAMAWASLETEYWAKWAQNSATTRASVFTSENMQEHLNGKGTVSILKYTEGGTSIVRYTSNTEPNVLYSLEIDANGVVSGGSSIVSWTIAVDANTIGEADVGDEVTSSTGESFYVIKKDSDKITLLSKYNLATSKNASGKYYQQDAVYGVTACKFADDDANSPYWTTADINSATGYTEGDAQEKAITYGAQNGGIGRLLTYAEYDALKGSIGDIIYGKDTTEQFLYYWLGTAYYDLYKDYQLVYHVSGDTNKWNVSNFYTVGGIGVRPVIEVPASDF